MSVKHVIVIETEKEIEDDNDLAMRCLQRLIEDLDPGQVLIASRWNQYPNANYGLEVPNVTDDHKSRWVKKV
jgi:hypothetical protein